MSTPNPQAEREQVAREWLIARGWCHLDASYQRVPVQGDVLALVALLAAQRAAGLEEAGEIAETLGVHPQLNVYGGGPDWYRHGKDIASKIRKLAQEQRP